jgi:hypothetical protein
MSSILNHSIADFIRRNSRRHITLANSAWSG